MSGAIREAFEKWYQSEFKRQPNDDRHETYIAWAAWQAALQSGEPVVDAVVFDILKAAQGSCRRGRACRADKQIQTAIDLLSAGKENNNE